MEEKDLIEGKELAVEIAKFAAENKAKDIKILDLKGISSFSLYALSTGQCRSERWR